MLFRSGRVIVETMAGRRTMEWPAVLVAGHGPCAWGRSAEESVTHAVALEAVAMMAAGTLRLNEACGMLEDYVLAKHYGRKHGPRAYYGQKG